jgi:hypothetical protein
MLCFVYAECHNLALNVKCRYAECHYAEHYAECHYAKCRYADCRGTNLIHSKSFGNEKNDATV